VPRFAPPELFASWAPAPSMRLVCALAEDCAWNVLPAGARKSPALTIRTRAKPTGNGHEHVHHSVEKNLKRALFQFRFGQAFLAKEPLWRGGLCELFSLTPARFWASLRSAGQVKPAARLVLGKFVSAGEVRFAVIWFLRPGPRMAQSCGGACR